jgi:hypothetical protein
MSISHIAAVLRFFPVVGDSLDSSFSDPTRIALSESNLRRLHYGSSGDYAVRTVTTKNTGKVYFECQMVDIVGADIWVGMGPSSLPNFNQRVGFNNSNSWAVGHTGIGVSNAFGTGSVFAASGIGSLVDNDTLCLAYDFATRKFWARINAGQWNGNNAANDPTAGTGGQTAAAGVTGNLYVMASSRLAGDDLRFRFLTSAMGYSIPSGFSAWG